MMISPEGYYEMNLSDRGTRYNKFPTRQLGPRKRPHSRNTILMQQVCVYDG